MFPNGAVFANTLGRYGYDVVLFGQVEPGRINVARMEQRLRSPEYAPVRKSLHEVHIDSGLDLLGAYAGQPSSLAAWLEGAVMPRAMSTQPRILTAFRWSSARISKGAFRSALERALQ